MNLIERIGQIHNDVAVEQIASEFAGRKDAYTVESFEPDPNSSAVVYSVSFKIARQADVDALNAYLAGLQ